MPISISFKTIVLCFSVELLNEYQNKHDRLFLSLLPCFLNYSMRAFFNFVLFFCFFVLAFSWGVAAHSGIRRGLDCVLRCPPHPRSLWFWFWFWSAAGSYSPCSVSVLELSQSNKIYHPPKNYYFEEGLARDANFPILPSKDIKKICQPPASFHF